jgi:hypothetical protein
MAVSYSDDEQTYFILMMRARGPFERRRLFRGRKRLVRGLPFLTRLSGFYMRSQGRANPLWVTDETIFELFDRALSFKASWRGSERGSTDYR